MTSRRITWRRAACVALFACVAWSIPVVTDAREPATYRSGSVYARVEGDRIVLGNSLVERAWDRSRLATTSLVDKRAGGREWSGRHRDFTLRIAGIPIGSDALRVRDVAVTSLDGGLRLRIELSGAPGASITRVVEAYSGIAGFRSQTIVTPTVPLALEGYTLEEVAAGADVAPTLHALRAGADWREPDWAGPPAAVGDPHAGTWRDTRSADVGAALSGPAQWASAGDAIGRTVFLVMERADLPSSRAGYDGAVLALDVDLSRDIASLGPFEEQVHVENPLPTTGRHRVLPAGVATPLEASFTGFGTSVDDEAWQHARYLAERRLVPYERAVVFNSNGTDANRISTGAKDDLDYETILEVAPIARSLGVETFVLDDGWQAISGDWYPDSPDHPEPRWDGTPGSMFAPRFPDSEMRAVREAIAPMRLGLWMSPLHFHPESATFRAHPEWACAPAGDALAIYNALDPESGSNEAGIGTWGPAALPHIEERMREAIERWGVEYFKLDFLVWLDCAGQGDMYAHREAFMAMLDRLRSDHPHVTFQIDETNDYRLFPFESVSRGPSWFQNGAPGPERLLHNLWNLSPYIPTQSIGQHVLGGRAYERYPVATLMAAALPSHVTFFNELRDLPDAVVEEAATWLAFYREHRDLLGGMAYPLLDDPLAGGWTALQPWDPDRGQGSLLVFRQGSSDAVRRVALRNVPPGRTFDLIEAPTGAPWRTVTSAELTAGIDIEVPDQDAARVLVVRPVGAPAGDATTEPSPPVGSWLAGDLHVHTCYSHDAYCGPGDDNTGPEDLYALSAPVEVRFAEAALRGLDYLAITDHNDVRSVTDPGFGSHGVVGIPGYEASYDGHAQVLGIRELLDAGDRSAGAIADVASRVRMAGGVFQINHPAEGLTDPFACDRTHLLDWGYGYEVRPDTIELWNIGHHFQPPLPSASSNQDAIAYWECWLERGERVAATGGSDSHWLSTTAVQGPGNPTTWVHAAQRSTAAVLAGLRAGRSSISLVPPALGGVPLILEADADGDGAFEALTGDTVPPGSLMRVRAEGATAAGLVDVRANGRDLVSSAPLALGGEVRFRAPSDRSTGWVRATLSVPDAAAVRTSACDGVLGSFTTYCRNAVTVVALTSPLYLAHRS